jgi:DNA-binding transcriptional MerR regulator
VSTSSRLLSIGEFAAATQLSQKALRIYDEQRLLPPAHIDAVTGYRYYSNDQVSLGRLVRTLREMNLSLTDIGTVISTSAGPGAEALLTQLAQDIDQGYARQKRAYHTALVLLRKPPTHDTPEITERERAETTVAVRPFVADRYQFVERFRIEAHALGQLLAQAQLGVAGHAWCALIDPLSEDESRLEVVLPIRMPERIAEGITLRQLPVASCATIEASVRHSHASEFAGALDALFDWFDRRGCHAIESPLVSIETDVAGLHTRIDWAFEQAKPAR